MRARFSILATLNPTGSLTASCSVISGSPTASWETRTFLSVSVSWMRNGLRAALPRPFPGSSVTRTRPMIRSESRSSESRWSSRMSSSLSRVMRAPFSSFRRTEFLSTPASWTSLYFSSATSSRRGFSTAFFTLKTRVTEGATKVRDGEDAVLATSSPLQDPRQDPRLFCALPVPCALPVSCATAPPKSRPSAAADATTKEILCSLIVLLRNSDFAGHSAPLDNKMLSLYSAFRQFPSQMSKTIVAQLKRYAGRESGVERQREHKGPVLAFAVQPGITVGACIV